MQFISNIEQFDSMIFTPQVPIHPMGSLFTYYPMEKPPCVHYHNFFEIGYCEGGSGVFLVDGEIVPFEGQCCSFMYEGQVHIARSIDPNKSLWHFLYMDLDQLFHADGGESFPHAEQPDVRRYAYPSVLPCRDRPEIYELTKLIFSEAAEAKEGCLFVIRRLTDALLWQLARMARTEGLRKGGEKPRYPEIGTALNYVSMHYMEDLTVESLAQVAQLSRPTFERKFSEATGMSPMRFVHRMRLNYAALLLQNEPRAISDVAMEVGYNSLSSFNRHFRAQYGTSPSAWKKRGTEP